VDYLCEQCHAHWGDLLELLSALGLPYEMDHRLVRGFDYYTRTVFEIVPPVEGSQSTLIGGGRYDGLIGQLGGSPKPGIGFGMGIERVIVNMERQSAVVPRSAHAKVAIVHVGPEARLEAFKLSSRLRTAGIVAVLAPAGRGLKGQLRYASAIEATHAVIIGDDELRKGALQLRDLKASVQREVRPEELSAALTA
jgi:histidyl-tRNA synthetase